MKFLEEEPGRLIKRCELIYKTLQSGTLKFEDGREFSYELTKPIISIYGRKQWEKIITYHSNGTSDLQFDREPRNLNVDDIDNYISNVHCNLTVKIINSQGKPIPRETIKSKVQRKFSGLAVWLTYSKVQFKKIDNVEEINEQSPDDSITDKERKKIKAVFFALKVGVLEYQDNKPGKVRYVLQDDYDIERGPQSGRPIIVLLGDAENVCRLYRINDDGSNGEYLTIDENQLLYGVITRRIEARFMKFNVSIIF